MHYNLLFLTWYCKREEIVIWTLPYLLKINCEHWIDPSDPDRPIHDDNSYTLL